MEMKHTYEEIILDDNEDKYDDVINEEEFYCTVVWISSRQSRHMEKIEPQWDNKKSYFQQRKENKVTFEEYMPSMKTEMNYNLLTQRIEKRNHME